MNKILPLFIPRFARAVSILILFAVVAPNVLADGRGAQIYESQCASCHGNEGLALNTPVLQGQEPAYIVRSLMAFKHGSRIDQIMMSMNSIAADLSDEDISVLARYLAGQDPCEIDLEIDYGGEGFREAFSAGRKQYAASNCGHCHESFHHYAPRIMGQKASYLKLALSQFQSGARVAPMMSRLLESWTEQDFQNVVTYISGMRLMRACGSDH